MPFIRNTTNPFASRACTDRFPFLDHLTMAELCERDRLREKRSKGPLDFDDAVRLTSLDRRSRPPIYDDPSPSAA